MSPQSPFHDEEPSAKRRKIRKGTQSCWECKKRKVRCIWTTSNDATCANCLRRKTKCISQEYPDEPQTSPRGIEDRMSRVEDLLAQLVNSASEKSRDAVQTITSQQSSEPAQLCPSPPATLTPATSTQDPSTPPYSSYTGLSRDLLTAWPSPSDFERICKLPIELSTHHHLNCRMSPSMTGPKEPITAQETLRLPPPDSHPILVARKLLLLASLLQGTLPTAEMEESERDYYTNIMSRAVETATRHVTSNDELTASVEGIECIIMEAQIHNHSGNLHRAWMTVRRAIAVAQVLGLHRKHARLPMRQSFDSLTLCGADRDEVCFCIVNMDRYLSLALGLPHSSFEGDTLGSAALAKCHPFDRMLRMHCIISGQILTRQTGALGKKGPESLEATSKMLEDAAALMPSDWWLAPTYAASYSTGIAAVPDTIRTMFQLSHYHLVMRLHLPYLLRSSVSNMYDSSKAAAVHASQESLSRYIAFRTWNTGQSYCRGVDYLSFIALTVLCFAHIDARNHANGLMKTVLTHSRRSDRAMMERTVEILGGLQGDTIAGKLSRIMRHLLDAEAAAANGVCYNASTSEDDEGPGTECGGQFVDGRQGSLLLHIPYFGSLSLQRKSVASTDTTQDVLTDHAGDMASASIGEGHQWSLFEWPNGLGPQDDWTLQSINEGLFGGLFGEIGDQPLDLDPSWSIDV